MSSGKKRPLEDEFQSDDDQKDRKRAASTSCKRPIEDKSQSDDDKEDRDRAASTSGNFDFVISERQMRRVIEKFNTSETFFEVKISHTPRSHLMDTMKEVDEGLKRLFGAVLEKVSGDLNPNDLMRICIQPTTVDFPISTDLLPPNQMTPEKILSIIQAGVPSGREIPLDEPLNIDVIVVKRS